MKFVSRAESTISKKRQLISLHSVREAISSGYLRVLKDPGETNLADIITKTFPIQGREEILNFIYNFECKSVRDKIDTYYHR